MKKLVFKTGVLLLCFLSNTKVFSQDVALSASIKPFAKFYNFSNKVVIKNAILEDGVYVYEYKKKLVNVEIKEGYYYEYLHNNQFLKAKIDWLSEFKYKLTIVDVETTQYPFKKGDALVAEIVEIDNEKYYYKSLFNGKTVRGNFERISSAKK